MRKVIGPAGVLVLLIGISGTIDHLFSQPLLGFVLNSVNRWVIPNIGFLAGYELFANLTVAALGGAVALAAHRAPD